MNIEKIVTGVLEENCYVISKDGMCLVVDPGDDYPLIQEKIKDNKVLAVLITHSHFDHIGALRKFLTKRNVKIFKKSSTTEQVYEIGPFKFKVINTPGHSSDSITFYFEEEKVMFVGDFIFKNSIGRCDLPTGSINEMNKSIDMIRTYPTDIKLYCGHGENTTLGNELEQNPYF